MPLPPGIDYDTLHDRLKDEGYIIYAGLGDAAKTTFRVCALGALTVEALEGFIARIRARHPARRPVAVNRLIVWLPISEKGQGQRMPSETVTVNARDYRVPERPTMVITIDGCDPRYLDDALARGLMPRLAAMLRRGRRVRPRPLSNAVVHEHQQHLDRHRRYAGDARLPGNHYLDPVGEEVQLSDPKFLRAPSIHKALHGQWRSGACVTAKDKLRRLLAHGGVPATSAEKAHECPIPAYGIDDVVAWSDGAIRVPTSGI